MTVAARLRFVVGQQLMGAGAVGLMVWNVKPAMCLASWLFGMGLSLTSNPWRKAEI